MAAFHPLQTLAECLLSTCGQRPRSFSLQRMIIRSEQQCDGDVIREVVRRAFAEAPQSSGTEPAIVDAVRASEALTRQVDRGRGGLNRCWSLTAVHQLRAAGSCAFRHAAGGSP